MTTTIAFDVYGTLIDPMGIVAKLGELVGDRGAAAARTWRDKQIEYLFRRGLMGRYEDFTVCTRQALDYTCRLMQLEIPDPGREVLMAQYRQLPAYPDVTEALGQIRAPGCRMYAFSNGEPNELAALMRHAGLDADLDGIVSVHDVQSFKPDPRVYRHFLDATKSAAEHTWLVSGNPFDVLGAAACGWKTAWLRRDPAATFDPWGVEPTLAVGRLGELASRLD